MYLEYRDTLYTAFTIEWIFKYKSNTMQNRNSTVNIYTQFTFLVTPSLQISKFKVNETSFHSVTLAGSLTPNEDCTGTQFSDPYGTWNNVVVQAIFKITVQERYATIHLNSNKIQLGFGIICTLSDTFCTDVEHGQTFWDTLANDVCNFNKYEIIYEGQVNKTYENTTDNSETFYSLTTEDITFVLAEKTRKPVCSYVLIQTEHQKLLIFETRPGNSFLENKYLEVQNMDIFTYVNSKFIYVERHIRTEVNRLYHDRFDAYHLMKSPGYMSVIAGCNNSLMPASWVEIFYDCSRPAARLEA